MEGRRENKRDMRLKKWKQGRGEEKKRGTDRREWVKEIRITYSNNMKEKKILWFSFFLF